MRIEGQQTYVTGQEVLWSLLHDPDTLARVLPGCEALEALGPHEFRGTFSIRLGQMVETFTGNLSLERSIPWQSYHFVARGKNPEGVIACRGRVILRDEGQEQTTLAYEAEIEVSGRPAQLTERMLQTTARSFVRRSLDVLQQQVDIRSRVHTTSAWGEGATRSAQSSHALDRLIFRRRLISAALVLLATLFLWRRASNRRERLVAEQVAELLDEAGLITPTSAGLPPVTPRGVA